MAKTCGPCQFVLNMALALDKLANAALLGDPNETVSRRIARARDAGSKPASFVCRIISKFTGGDHCDYSEQSGSLGRELWHWSANFTEPTL